MNRRLFIILLAIFLGSTSAMVTRSYGEESHQGKGLYDSKCAICHGEEGKGNGRAAASLSPKPEDFTRSRFWKGNVDKKIADTIRNGIYAMPAFDLSEAEIKAITEYMKKTFKK
jgi:mono/diheme cytochrome c family protein